MGHQTGTGRRTAFQNRDSRGEQLDDLFTGALEVYLQASRRGRIGRDGDRQADLYAKRQGHCLRQTYETCHYLNIGFTRGIFVCLHIDMSCAW